MPTEFAVRAVADELRRLDPAIDADKAAEQVADNLAARGLLAPGDPDPFPDDDVVGVPVLTVFPDDDRPALYYLHSDGQTVTRPDVADLAVMLDRRERLFLRALIDYTAGELDAVDRQEDP